MSNEVLDTNKPCPHSLHFYDTGNVLLEVENVLFRIHQEVLCRHSEVFKDMFSLDLAGDMDRSGDQCSDRKVTLHEDREDFATFLDIIYEVPGVDFAYIGQCVRLSLLAHKYEVPHIVERCRNHLIASLPIGATERDFWIAEEAYEDASIIPSLLRAARLIDMPNVIPWAVYKLSVQFESKPRWVTENKAILEPFSESVQATHALKRHVVSRWRRFVTRFMKGDCDAEWWVEEDDCWRRTTLEDLENSGFMVEKDTLDPLRDMHEVTEFCCEGLCSICSDTWVKCATAFMEDFLEGVGSIVWD
ncbi:unnamed protein product [Rhizoctonia solani]|uniref:BTB domain-containing protein n=1 Tax=Rhizoctonia solani TaxID=456999 RepID=A0A8H2XQU5_9AGAM|nr:unnamed protein product [Rhizoctonia solani]